VTTLKKIMLVAGCIALLVGLIWIGQGTGYFPYPRSSFMISQLPWAHRGAALAAAGIILIVISRKARRRGVR
jgi:membrane protein implicated in regulation of membrane protease activity